jgi:hypothetical protein
MLRGGLEESTATQRSIAERVSNTLQASTTVDFNETVAQQAARKQSTDSDLQNDMTELADVQIRFDAQAKLLHDAYSRIRTAFHDRA